MIASWRGLAVASAIAVALVIAVVIDVVRAPAPIDRALVPGLDPGRVTELVWERAGQPALRVTRGASGWTIAGPALAPGAPADPAAVGEVLAALRGARWHRRGEPGSVTTTLTVTLGGERRVLGLGASVEGTGQTWIAAGGRGLLVDDWVARALDRDALGLRIRRPFADVGRAATIVVEGAVGGSRRVALRLEGTPRRLVRPAPLVIAAELAGALERALREIEIVRLADGPLAGQGLAITVAAEPGGVVTLELRGACPGEPARVAVSGTFGDGCIEPAAAAAIERAVLALAQPAAELAERRPVPFEPARIVLPDGAALETAPLEIAGAPADPARVAELLAVLAAPAEVVAVPAATAHHQLVVTDRAGAAITLELFASRVLARRGEPVALRPSPGAWALLVRPSRELRDPALWLEEPTAIAALQIDGVRYARGAVIGAWTRTPAGRVDAAAVEALVGQLAAPRSLGFVDEPVAITHRVTLAIQPPVGAAAERVIQLGAPRAGGCPARLERATVLLPARVCAQAAALAR